MFQCHSLKSSHTCPLPQSPKDCSIHLCLFCCLAYRVIVNIFLFSFLNISCIFIFKFDLFYFIKFYLIFKLYNIVLILPNIKMNPPREYPCSPSWTLLPPPYPYPPSGSSQCTSPKHPAFFIVQLSHPYVTSGKTVALTRWTFVAKVMSLLLNMLSRLVGHNFPSKE